MSAAARKFPAWLAIVFGTLGVLLCLVALVFVWIGSARLQRATTDAAGSFSRTVTRVAEGADGASARIEVSRGAVSELKSETKERLASTAAEAVLDSRAVSDLVARVRSLQQRLEDWKMVMASLRELSMAFEELLVGLLAFFQADVGSLETVRAALGEGETRLGEAAAALEEVEAKLTREGSEAGPVRDRASEEFDALFARVDGALVSAITETTAFSEGVKLVDARLQGTASRINRTIGLVALALTLLLLWQAAAQFSLARWGWAK